MSKRQKAKPFSLRKSSPDGKMIVGNNKTSTSSNHLADETLISEFVPLSEEERQQCLISEYILSRIRTEDKFPVEPRNAAVSTETTSFLLESNVELWRSIRSESEVQFKTSCTR